MKRERQAYNKLETIYLDEVNGCVIFLINQEIFSKDIVLNASYIMSDRADFFLDVDEKNHLVVELKSIGKITLKELIREFNIELLNYAVYKQQSEKNADLRKTLLKAALETNTKT